jgi:hypothetical protein
MEVHPMQAKLVSVVSTAAEVGVFFIAAAALVVGLMGLK